MKRKSGKEEQMKNGIGLLSKSVHKKNKALHLSYDILSIG
jgi:hypothetical protein